MKRLIVLLFALAALASGVVSCGLRGTRKPPTPTPTPTPTPLPVQAIGGEEVTVHTLRLEEEISFPKGGIEEEIAEFVRSVLAGVGVQVVVEGVPCDATLTILLVGQSVAANYVVSGLCYTGAEVSGEVTVAIADREPLTLLVNGGCPAPRQVSHCPKEPAEAPFYRVWPEAVLDGLAHLWGPPVLIQALESEGAWVRRPATEALGEIGVEEGVVPALIQALGDKDEDVRKVAAYALGKIGSEAKEAVAVLSKALKWKENIRRKAAWALGEITGQDFSEDPDRWQEWWEEQQ